MVTDVIVMPAVDIFVETLGPCIKNLMDSGLRWDQIYKAILSLLGSQIEASQTEMNVRSRFNLRDLQASSQSAFSNVASFASDSVRNISNGSFDQVFEDARKKLLNTAFQNAGDAKLVQIFKELQNLSPERRTELQKRLQRMIELSLEIQIQEQSLAIQRKNELQALVEDTLKMAEKYNDQANKNLAYSIAGFFAMTAGIMLAVLTAVPVAGVATAAAGLIAGGIFAARHMIHRKAANELVPVLDRLEEPLNQCFRP